MLPEQRTVGALLVCPAQAIPQHEPVVFPPRRLTYAAPFAQAAEVIRLLTDRRAYGKGMILQGMTS
jgi:hypothetical protein